MVRKLCSLLVLVYSTGFVHGEATLALGSALETPWAADKTLPSLMKSQYSFLSPTSSLTWEGDSAWVSAALTLGLPYRGPRLAGSATPARLDALDAKGLDREFIARLKNLRSMAITPPLSWDVASGIFNAAGDPADSVFQKTWGPDWPARALRLAADTDPGTPLFLAEDDVLGLNPKSDAFYRLVSELKARGLPLTGVALGGRQRVSYRASALEVGANLQRFADLGLIIHVVDWDFGLDQDQSVPDRAAVAAQSTAYQETLTWMLAVGAVKAVSVAEPSDLFARTRSDGVYAAPSLVSAAGVPKSIASTVTQLLKKPRLTVAELSTAAPRRAELPLNGMDGAGLPKSWSAEVSHLVPATEETPPGAEFRHRATFFRNPPQGTKAPGADDFGMNWYLSWTREGLVFQVDRSDDQVLLGNRGEGLTVEIRGPGFAASRDLTVGTDFKNSAASGTWSSDGRSLRVVFKVPANAEWGKGTLFFFRFSGADNDGSGQSLILDPWPTAPGGGLPWRGFRIVAPLS